MVVVPILDCVEWDLLNHHYPENSNLYTILYVYIHWCHSGRHRDMAAGRADGPDQNPSGPGYTTGPSTSSKAGCTTRSRDKKQAEAKSVTDLVCIVRT